MDAAHHGRDELLRARQATCAMVRPALGNRGLPSHAQERLPHQRPSIGHRTRPAGLPWCRYGGRLARLSSDDASREMPDLPCTVYFTDEEWKALCCYTTGSPLSPKQPPSLDSATRMVGAMGGHLGRKRDGPPGAQTLWRGLQRLDPAAKVYRILTTGPPLHASGP